MKKELNEYLFFEFGFDLRARDIATVREDWPFVLEEVGTIEVEGNINHIFVFEHEGTKYYGVYGPVIQYLPISEMDLTVLKWMFAGTVWLGHKEPINLEMVKLNDPAVPSSPEIREAITNLAKTLDSKRAVNVLEGLFLKSTREYLGLVQFDNDVKAHIVGNRMRIRNIPFEKASARQRIAIGIGKLLEEGKVL